ncbi:hypothetical protein DA89_3352 [Vibrio cholerae]|nr:hypothetical protein DA89_3352 [Vibrio cholerae]
MPHSSLDEANPTSIASSAFDRLSNTKCEVCEKYSYLSYFLIRDFAMYNDTLLKTYAYTKFKCIAHA